MLHTGLSYEDIRCILSEHALNSVFTLPSCQKYGESDDTTEVYNMNSCLDDGPPSLPADSNENLQVITDINTKVNFTVTPKKKTRNMKRKKYKCISPSLFLSLASSMTTPAVTMTDVFNLLLFFMKKCE